MSATANYEPDKLPAGILALVVHGAFFALMYLGFSWQTQPPETMSVELWQSLPDRVAAPPAEPKVEENVEKKVEEIVPPPPPPKPVKMPVPDIALPDKKKVEVKPIESKPEKKIVETKPVAPEPVEQKPATRVAEQQLDGAQAVKAAAIQRIVDEYSAKITAKIRRNIVEPPNLAKDASAKFSVTLLPGGAVLNARLVKSSGNAAYDDAVERAIIKSDPLPLPPDPALFNLFREFSLNSRSEY